MIGSIGQLAVRFLLVAVCLSGAAQIVAIRTQTSRWRRLARHTMLLLFVITAVASAALIWLLVSENLAYAYVADYTSAGLALIYRVAAFWGGNAGSLLFWSLVLTLYGAVVAYSRHEDSDRMLPIVSLILTGIVAFYTVVLNTLADPFQRLAHAAVAGNGLNPLLQNPGMTVHPVNVYLGYVGFAVPFAYAMAGLWLKKTDATWIRVTRRWTLISWLFLGIGIIYGAHWSYEELGWGGYWAWDPVENASLLPWLTGTAFLHSAIVQEKKGMLKAWNVILATLTFVLTLLGTFLTRSGVLWSIHAFANGPLGAYFLTFLLAVTVASAGLIVWRWSTLRPDRRIEAVVSKESGFLLNNVLFLGSTFAVLWGTVFPILSQAFAGRQMVVSGPFYNTVNLPLGVCILLLMGVGPVIAWRRAHLRSVLRAVVYPLVIAVGLGLLVAGLLRYDYGRASVLGTLAIVAACFVLLTVFLEFFRSVQARVALTGESRLHSLTILVSRHRRRYGGYIVHVAIAVMAIGIAGSGAYHIDLQQQLAVGQTAQIGAYRATYEGLGVASGPGTRQMYANLVVQRGDRTIGVLRPAATFYTNGQSPSTNVALFSRPVDDLYVVMLGTHAGAVVFDFHVNPLVQFIWFGGYLFIAGTVLSLWPERMRQRADRRQPGATAAPAVQWEGLYEELAELEYDYRMGKLDQPEYERHRSALLAQVSQAERAQMQLRARLVSEVEDVLHRGTTGSDGQGDLA